MTHAQPLPTATPETIGMSSTRLERITELIQRKLQSGELVGAVTLVARRGKIVHFKAQGQADVEADKPMTTDTIFRIYSMTKPITSVAAMMLYEEGKFQLHDPVGNYLPELKELEVWTNNGTNDGGREPARRPVSVRDILTHRSGFVYGFFGDTPVDKLYRKGNASDPSGTTADLVRKLGELPLVAHPGAEWNYSVSTDVLGRLVEVISGQPLDEFFQDRILGPLDMKDTAFSVPTGKVDRFPVNYRWDDAGQRGVADAPPTSRYLSKPTFHSGGGGLVSTTADYVRFCQMLLNGGRLGDVELLSPKTVWLMTQNHLGHAKTPTSGVVLGAGAGFGLGFRIITDPATNQRLVSKGTYSWGGMASTMFFIDPQEELVGIIMSQKLPTDLRIRDEFQTTVYQALTELNE